MKHILEEANKILGTNFKSFEILSAEGELNEDFIREFHNELDWEFISIHQKLSESLIRKFKNKVDWCDVARFQIFSKEFANEFLEYLVLYSSILNKRKDELGFKIEFVSTLDNNKHHETML